MDNLVGPVTLFCLPYKAIVLAYMLLTFYRQLSARLSKMNG
jgi:hypothetical protein